MPGATGPAVLASLKTRYFFTPAFEAAHYERLPRQELEQTLTGELRRSLEAKEAEIGNEPFNLFIRYEYLRAIDSRWQDHLENLSALQEAVRLRAYSQKNPLLEYKLEGFQIFDQMLDEIRVAIAEKIFKVTIRHTERQPARSGAVATARTYRSGSSRTAGRVRRRRAAMAPPGIRVPPPAPPRPEPR